MPQRRKKLKRNLKFKEYEVPIDLAVCITVLAVNEDRAQEDAEKILMEHMSKMIQVQGVKVFDPNEIPNA